jgi:two-component system, NarL family, nitrate/nitrite response regulator NarL
MEPLSADLSPPLRGTPKGTHGSLHQPGPRVGKPAGAPGLERQRTRSRRSRQSARTGRRRSHRFGIVLADSNPVFLQGLRSVLEDERDFDIVAICEDSAACIDAIRAASPDLALFEMSLPGRGALHVLAAIAADGLRVRTVLLTSPADGERATRAMLMGACGVVPREVAPQSLVRWLRQVACGQLLVPISGHPGPALDPTTTSIVALTPREQQVLALVAAGLTNYEASIRLGICENTVKVHLHHLYVKLAITGRTARVDLARVPLRRSS